MRVAFTVVTPSGRTLDVEIAGAPETTLSAVAAALAPVAGLRQPPVLFAGVRPLAGEDTLGSGHVRDGSVVGLDAPVEPLATPIAEPLVLRVVDGDEAGAEFPLAPGPALIGRGREADIAIPAAAVSRRHARVDVTPECITVADAGSTNGTWLDGAPVHAAVVWPHGARVRIGGTTLTWSGTRLVAAQLQDRGDGTLVYVRRPRVPSPAAPASIALPVPPPGLSHNRFAVVSTRAERRRYQEDLEEVELLLAAAVASDQERRRTAQPGPDELLLNATRPGARLWERRPTDRDALLLRVGLADRPAAVELLVPPGTPHPDPPVAHDVPVGVPLREAGVLGVLLGPSAARRGLARWLVAQAAILHSPRDLAIVLLCDPDADDAWGWMRWLPHVRRLDHRASDPLIGNDEETVRRRVGDLVALVERRQRMLATPGGRNVRFPDVLVVVDGATWLRSIPGLRRVLQQGPAVGVGAVCIDGDAVPEECGMVVEPDAGHPGTVAVRGRSADPVAAITADAVDASWAERVARAMAPIREGDHADEEAGLQVVPPARLHVLGPAETAAQPPAIAVVPWSALGRCGEPPADAVEAGGPIDVPVRTESSAAPVGDRSASRHPADPEPHPLSRRELQVVALVADGLTNAEIGHRLYISEHTVAKHIGSILTKLDMVSRTQVARWAVEHGVASD